MPVFAFITLGSDPVVKNPCATVHSFTPGRRYRVVILNQHLTVDPYPANRNLTTRINLLTELVNNTRLYFK